MTAPDDSSTVERSTMRRFFQWLFSRRFLRRILICLAWLVTVVALFHGEEDWRGRHAWNKYRQTLEAQGAQLDYTALIPKPVPDDQNFAATPAVKAWFVKRDADAGEEKWPDDFDDAYKIVREPRTQDGRGKRHFEDLAGLEAALAAVRTKAQAMSTNSYAVKLNAESRAQAAPAVLEALKTNEALFAELRLASQRPYSRYPIDYNTDPLWALQLPHISKVRGVCDRLRLKACAELAVGQSEQALADLRLAFYLGDSGKSDACLISSLVRFACLQLAVQPIWEGLAEYRWSDAQLQELENRLLQYHLIADMKYSFDVERTFGVSTIEFFRHNGLGYLKDLGDHSSMPATRGQTLSKLIGWVATPRGWYYLEELNYCRGFEAGIASGVDYAHDRVLPAQVKANALDLERTIKPGGLGGTPVGIVLRHRLMSGLLLPALNKVLSKAAAAQTVANQAALACALERYRLANKQFPEKLDSLAPQFISALPVDVLTGEPYKYRLADDGHFVLYSIGWDEKDDGGRAGKKLFDEKEGDWVWEYPAR